MVAASRGFGLELARQLLASGAHVIATVRTHADREQLQAIGAQVLTVDVTDPASISGLASQLGGKPIDLAFYVAGVMRRPSATEPPTQRDFDAVMHANVLGAMQLIPCVAPMVEAAGGVFAFMSSNMSQIANVPGSNAWLYRTSKAALNMAVAAAQHDYPASTLITMDPGWVQTDMGNKSALLSLKVSVGGMLAKLAALTPADKGQLLRPKPARLKTAP